MDNIFKLSYTVDKEQSLSVRVYNIGHERCKSNQKWGPGVRDFYLMHHVISGKGFYLVNNNKYEISAGDTFMIYPNTPVTYYADSKEPWEYYWVGFQGNDAKLIIAMTDFTKDNPVLDFDVRNELKKLLANIYDVKGKEEACKIKMTGYLMLALSLFIREKDYNSQNLSYTYCQKAAEYIAYNYSQPISIEDIANYIGISRSQLYRVFIQIFNKPPKQYLTEYRVGQAINLLKNPELTINTVGKSVGFEDNLYFSRMFKKYKGSAPSVYRKETLGN